MASPFDHLHYPSWLAGSTESAEVAVPLILDAFAASSAVDVGCGLGAWLAVLERHGVLDIHGYDGSWVDRSQLLIPPGAFTAADLADPLPAPRRYDVALCLEVGHLLEPGEARVLVESLVALADIVVFSAAIPGQGGTHHVNEQWPRYWADLFRVHDYGSADPFRALLWESPDVKWWFAQNLVCFARTEVLDRNATLSGARCAEAPLSLVHPGCLQSALDAGAARAADAHDSPSSGPSQGGLIGALRGRGRRGR